jgi:hypothetical protein
MRSPQTKQKQKVLVLDHVEHTITEFNMYISVILQIYWEPSLFLSKQVRHLVDHRVHDTSTQLVAEVIPQSGRPIHAQLLNLLSLPNNRLKQL